MVQQADEVSIYAALTEGDMIPASKSAQGDCWGNSSAGL